MDKYLLYGEFMTLPGEGSVYKGRKRGTVEFFAIQKHKKGARELVANAVRLMHNLEHPNVLAFTEWYETPKHIWLITELANGGTLADILDQDGPIPFPQVNDFVVDIMAGLSYVHSKQIAYCDLHPAKMMLDSCQNLKLCDFTLAQLVGEEKIAHSDILRATKGIFQGQHHLSDQQAPLPELDPCFAAPSPFYTAPEVITGGQFSFSSDLWSLGCVIFELCTGRRPFRGNSAEELLRQICHGETVMSSEEIVARTSEDANKLVQLIFRLLKKSSQHRPSWKQLLQFPIFQGSGRAATN